MTARDDVTFARASSDARECAHATLARCAAVAIDSRPCPTEIVS